MDLSNLVYLCKTLPIFPTWNQSFSCGLDPDNWQDHRRETGNCYYGPAVKDPVKIYAGLEHYQTQGYDGDRYHDDTPVLKANQTVLVLAVHTVSGTPEIMKSVVK